MPTMKGSRAGDFLLLAVAGAARLAIFGAFVTLISHSYLGSRLEGLQPGIAEQWSIGYWTPWGDPPTPISDLDWAALTHVVHHAAFVKSDSSLDLSSANIASNAATLIQTAHGAGVKVLLGIANKNQNVGLPAAMDGDSAKLVGNICDLAESYGYDGVDIDWEPFSASRNGAQMSALATGLRACLSGKILTTAAGSGDYSYWGSAHAPFDRINIMTYDMTGTWNPYSWHNAPLQSADLSAWPSKVVWSISGAVNLYGSSGIPLAKIGIGIPFYGWRWAGGGVNGPRQTWTSVPSLTQVPYNKLISQISPANYNWDPVASVPFLSIRATAAEANQFITFDDERSIAAKVSFAKGNNLGGWIIWALDQDYFPSGMPKHPLLQAVKAAIQGAQSGPTSQGK